MDNKNTKILFILDLYTPHVGGVEILFENIISRLEKKGKKIIILTSHFSKDIKKYEKISENIEIYRSGRNRYIFMFSSIFLGMRLAKNVDIIHTTTYNAAFPAYIIGKLSGKKVVITVHEIFGKLWYKFMGWKGFFFKLYENFIFLLGFEKYICVSNYTKNSLRIRYGIKDKKLYTVYNGIDLKKWNKKNYKKDDILQIRKKYNCDSSYTGLYFGRPGISKGLEYYIESVQQITKNIPNFKALCIVPENDRERVSFIKNKISKLGVEKNVVWIPGVSNSELGNYILASDFVIVPSLAEGFGFSAAETCALEKNIVVSEVASLPEVVSGKVVFVEPGNSADIARGVTHMFQGKYIEIPKKDFSWDENIEKTLEIYKDVLGKEI